MHLFTLVRDEDVSGISGTGPVAGGVEFADGTVVMQWFNTYSIGIYKDRDQLLNIHGHDGRTRLEWEN